MINQSKCKQTNLRIRKLVWIDGSSSSDCEPWSARVRCQKPQNRWLFAQFDFSSGWEWRFTSLAGVIHNSDPSIHNLIHNFWQGNGRKWWSLGNCTGFATGFSGVRVGVQNFVPQTNPYPWHGYRGLVAGWWWVFLSIDPKNVPNMEYVDVSLDSTSGNCNIIFLTFFSFPLPYDENKAEKRHQGELFSNLFHFSPFNTLSFPLESLNFRQKYLKASKFQKDDK